MGLIHPTVEVIFILTRRPKFYVLNLIIPSAFVSVLSVFVFLLPAESGEKISLQVTAFFSYMVLLLVIADVTPTNGTNLPIIGS